MKKLVVLVLCLSLCASLSLMAGGQGETKEEGPITLTVWGWDQHATESVVTQVEKFKSENPNVDFELLDMGPQDVRQKLSIALTSGTGAPDVCFNSCENVFNFYKVEGLLLPLSDYIPNWQKDLSPALSSRWTYNGELMGAPFSISPFVIFYRKDVMDEVGVDFENELRTMKDDYVTIGKKVTIPNERYMAPWRSAWNWTCFAWGMDAQITNQDDDLLFEKDPRSIEVFQWTYDNLYKHKINEYGSPEDVENYVKYKEGRYTCMTYYWFYIWKGLKDLGYSPDQEGKWRVAQMRSWDEPGKMTGSDFIYHGIWLVPGQTKYPDAARRFAASICNQENQVEIANRRTIFPANVKAQAELAEVEDPFFGGQKINKIGMDTIRDMPEYTVGENLMVIVSALVGAADKVYLNHMPVEQAFKEAAQQARKEME